MSRIAIVPAVAAALALAALAAGCGGSDSETSSGETSTVAVNERLTADQWDAYQAAAGPFTEANTAMLKKIDACPRSGTGDTTVFSACLGDTLTTVTDATRELTTVLAGFNGTVSGACATALDAYTNYTTPYLASITSMQQAIDSENASALTSSYSNAQTAASGGKEERATFEQECAPA